MSAQGLCSRRRAIGVACVAVASWGTCTALGTRWENYAWMVWRRWCAWLLLFAWQDDVASGYASDCLPERCAGDRYPSRQELRAWSCAVLAQRYGDGCKDDLAARWAPLWSRWLNGETSDPTTAPLFLRSFGEAVYAVKRGAKATAGLRTLAGGGDELAARVLAWEHEGYLRALAEHAHCRNVLARIGFVPRRVRLRECA